MDDITGLATVSPGQGSADAKTSIGYRPYEASSYDIRGDALSGQSQLAELLSILKRNWFIFLVVLFAVFAAGTFILMKQTRYYTAETTVLFDPRNRQVVDFTPVVSGFSADSQTLETEIATELQLVASRRVTDPVMAEFDLAHDPEFVEVKPGAMSRLIDSLSENTPHWLAALLDLPTAPAPLTGEAAAAERRQQMLKVFADRLKVQVQGHSTAILIAFTSENPVLAAEVANAIAASYAQLSVLDKAKAAQDALATMTRRSTELRDQAVAADSAVEDYRNSAHLIEGTNGNIITAQIGEYNSSLVQAQADLATAQSRIVDKNGSAADPDNAPAVLASPVIQHLREEQARQNGLLAQEKTRQGDSYPGVSGRKLALLDLAKQIGVETSSIITAQRNAADAAQARVNLLAAKLADVWKQSASFAAADVHLRQLKLEASVQHNLYESYLRRIQEISQQVGTAQPYVDIISPAEVPRRTSLPEYSVAAAMHLRRRLGFGIGQRDRNRDAQFRFSLRPTNRSDVRRPARRIDPANVWRAAPLAAMAVAERGLLGAIGSVHRSHPRAAHSIALVWRRNENRPVYLRLEERRQDGNRGRFCASGGAVRPARFDD